MLQKMAPGIFVLLWSTGFIGAKFGLPFAEPLTLLTIRMALNLVVFAAFACLVGSKTVRPRQAGHAMVVGALIHAVYLGGVFWAISRGMPAGLAALVVGLQPLVTAILSIFWFRQYLLPVQWGGMLLGFGGVFLVLSGRFDWSMLSGELFWPVAVCVSSLFAITIGAMYQKRFCGNVDLVWGAFWQYFAALVVLAPIAYTTESMHVNWTPTFIATMGWLVLVLSFAAILLLMYLVRHGDASKVASLFYLVPPLAALEAFVLFDERFGLIGAAGFAVTAVGVYLVMRPPRRRVVVVGGAD
ncbi:DMT family transporter [Aestuariispira ectoiniformans]|uniref:DMT family transporter n=1 Tax=Aestuariispira ectoiniformans TaxID=2775080 RepID=UPI00223A7AA6|nr:DMT family transporter [Aestuariispira ectoiniformans]